MDIYNSPDITLDLFLGMTDEDAYYWAMEATEDQVDRMITAMDIRALSLGVGQLLLEPVMFESLLAKRNHHE